MRNNRLLLLPVAAIFALGLAACEEGVEQDQAANEEEGQAGYEESGSDVAATPAETDSTQMAETGQANQSGQAGEEIDAVAIAESEEHGQYLASADGRAVYVYFADSEGQSNCTGQCAEKWPPVLAQNGQPQVDDSSIDQSKLGTIQREDGTQQVTYDGQPLYFYAEDRGPGEATGQGVNNQWALLSADGEPVRSEQRGSAQL